MKDDEKDTPDTTREATAVALRPFIPTMPGPGEVCRSCEHVFDDHIFAATNTGLPLDGGVFYCPVKGCECQGTWDVPQAAEIREKYGNAVDSSSGQRDADVMESSKVGELTERNDE